MNKMFYVATVILAVVTVSALFWFTSYDTSEKNTPPSDEVFNVGVVVPLSGKNAQYGQWIREGLSLAAEDINSDGGVLSKKIKLHFEDDKAEPANAALALQRLIAEHNVKTVYGSWASSSVLAMAPIAEEQQVLIMASAISPKIREAGDYIFRMQPDARAYIRPLVPYALEALKSKKLAIFYVNNDFGKDQSQVFSKLFEESGGEVVFNEGYQQDSTDFRAELTKMRRKSPDTIFLVSYAEIGQILRQAHEIGLEDVQFLGSVPTENPDLFKTAGEYAEGIIFPSHFDALSSNLMVRDFAQQYERKYNEKPEGLAALAYDGLFAIAKAAELSGSTEAEDIKNGLYALPVTLGVTGNTSFDENGDVLKPIIIKTVVNQAFVVAPNNQK